MVCLTGIITKHTALNFCIVKLFFLPWPKIFITTFKWKYSWKLDPPFQRSIPKKWLMGEDALVTTLLRTCSRISCRITSWIWKRIEKPMYSLVTFCYNSMVHIRQNKVWIKLDCLFQTDTMWINLERQNHSTVPSSCTQMIREQGKLPCIPA